MDLDNTNAGEGSSTTSGSPTTQDWDEGVIFQKTEDGKIIMDEKSFYGKIYGPMKTLEKKFNQMEAEKRSASQDDDYSDVLADLIKDGYDETEAKALIKTNQKMMAKQLQKIWPMDHRQTAEEMEEQKFLMAHPEMYDYIDEIKRVKELAPSRSLSQIAKSMGYMNEAQSAGNGGWFRTAGNEGGGNVSPDAKKEADEKAAAQADFDKLLGRS